MEVEVTLDRKATALTKRADLRLPGALEAVIQFAV